MSRTSSCTSSTRPATFLTSPVISSNLSSYLSAMRPPFLIASQPASGTGSPPTRELPIDFTQHNVQTSDDGHHVRNHFALAHDRERRQIHKARSAKMHAVRFRSAVRFHVYAQLALRSLDRHIDLTRGNVESFGDDQEVVDQ